MRKTCIDCLFCTKVCRVQNGGVITFSLTNNDRLDYKKNDLDFLKNKTDLPLVLKCYGKKWNKIKEKGLLKHSCKLFTEYDKDEAKNLKARLQEAKEREKNNKENRKFIKVVIWTILGTIISTVVAAIIWFYVNNQLEIWSSKEILEPEVTGPLNF